MEGQDDSDGITSFFFCMMIVHPGTAWILRPGRFERKKITTHIIAFLVCLSAIITGECYFTFCHFLPAQIYFTRSTLCAVHEGMCVQARGPTHYQLLGVTRESIPLEIKRSHRKFSVTLHPNKNPSPTATEEFDAVKRSRHFDGRGIS